jgi:hypothetical protein
LVLAVAPSLLVEVLLDGTAAGITVSRVAGVAILALGVACWLARQYAAGRAARGLIAAMLLYNAAVAAILVLLWTNQGLSGVALWPVGAGPRGAGGVVRRGPVGARKAMTI